MLACHGITCGGIRYISECEKSFRQGAPDGAFSMELWFADVIFLSSHYLVRMLHKVRGSSSCKSRRSLGSRVMWTTGVGVAGDDAGAFSLAFEYSGGR